MSLECRIGWAGGHPSAAGLGQAIGVTCPFPLNADKVKSEQLLKLTDKTQSGKLLHVVLQH